ncbi:hypothetical protein NPIL_222601, partial [Nephila pilipes]
WTNELGGGVPCHSPDCTLSQNSPFLQTTILLTRFQPITGQCVRYCLSELVVCQCRGDQL